MNQAHRTWSTPQEHLTAMTPDHPVLYCAPRALAARAGVFLDGFPGLVSYAVKANPDATVLHALGRAGVTAYDVASPGEIDLVRRHQPQAVMHYNNPVRTAREIVHAVEAGVVSYSVDRMGELDKLLARLPEPTEIAVRFKLPVRGAAYDFGEKFGASPEQAIALLAKVAAAGHIPALTFHPGTQCPDPTAWASYITTAAKIAKDAGTPIARLNVGGGFPAGRGGPDPDYTPFFDTIRDTTRAAFGDIAPALVCEPGRALVSDCMTLAVRVKSVDGERVYLNDGLYGALAEMRDIAPQKGIRAVGREFAPRTRAVILYGPTCDSLDRVPDPVPLPRDIAEDDYILFPALGAYGRCIATGFNGYGEAARVRVQSL